MLFICDCSKSFCFRKSALALVYCRCWRCRAAVLYGARAFLPGRFFPLPVRMHVMKARLLFLSPPPLSLSASTTLPNPIVLGIRTPFVLAANSFGRPECAPNTSCIVPSDFLAPPSPRDPLHFMARIHVISTRFYNIIIDTTFCARLVPCNLSNLK